MIDTHAHIYAEEFDADKHEMILRAKQAGVSHIVMPNVDSESLPRMLALESEYPAYCFAAIGLHPTSVNAGFEAELAIVEQQLTARQFVAIGEIGIDLYWDKTFLNEQKIAFTRQLHWAIKYNLPVIIHVRDSFDEVFELLDAFDNKSLTGVFHSFTGNIDQAQKILSYGGFKIGINGIVTFKNSGLANVVKQIGIENIVVETDAPYLTPTPYRGKRNESAYVAFVVDKISEIFNIEKTKVDSILTRNALEIFKNISI